MSTPLQLTPSEGLTSLSREAFVQVESLAGRGLARRRPEATSKPSILPQAVVDFWRHAGPNMWFAKDPEFDLEFRQRFIAAHEAAAGGKLAEWAESANGALALILLLDQFPRNAFRGTPRMYETDTLARRVADAAIDMRHDQAFDTSLRLFFYLPFAHSESQIDQDYSVALCRQLSRTDQAHAEHHRDIIRRFGRFPHRNPILGRTMLPEEQRFLDEGGYAG